MGKHTIYLNDSLESEMRAVANSEGWTLNEVIRKRLETATSQIQYQQTVINLEKKVKAIYALLDLIVGDMGYVIGATRASTKSIESISREGAKYEAYVKRVTSAFKVNFDNIENIDFQKNLMTQETKEV